MAEDEAKKEEPVKFLAKKNCKSCHERGYIIRTTPMGTGVSGEKKMSRHKTLCHCVTEIKTPEPDECVVPKVATEPNNYASTAQPLH